MYGIVLAAALTSGTTAADWGFKHRCHGGCACSCWCGGCGCYGGYGCYGCGGCYCGGGHGCWTTCGCYGCYGYCGGWSCCSCSCGCYGGGYVSGACYGCYGACTAIPYGGAAPAVGVPVIEGGVIIGGEVKATSNRPATVIVKASKDIQLKVNGQEAPRKNDEETYTSPALTPGRTYTYTFVAERVVDGKPVTETKEVAVYAGRSTLVDFSNFGQAAVAKTEAEAAPANVTVVLPENAKLTVNDVAITAKGKQTFATPKLEKGKSYFYTVKAEIVRDGKPVTETRKIDVAAGKDVTVDFTVNATLTASR